MLKFAIDYKVRRAKLSISKKCKKGKKMLKCAGEWKVRHVRGSLKFYYNGFLLEYALMQLMFLLLSELWNIKEGIVLECQESKYNSWNLYLSLLWISKWDICQICFKVC